MNSFFFSANFCVTLIASTLVGRVSLGVFLLNITLELWLIPFLTRKAHMFKKSAFEYLLHIQHMPVLWGLQSVWVYDCECLFLTELNIVYTAFLNILNSEVFQLYL